MRYSSNFERVLDICRLNFERMMGIPPTFGPRFVAWREMPSGGFSCYSLPIESVRGWPTTSNQWLGDFTLITPDYM